MIRAFVLLTCVAMQKCTFWPMTTNFYTYDIVKNDVYFLTCGKKVSVLSNLWGLAGICGGMKRYKFVLSHQWIYIYLCTSDLWGLAGICGGMRRWEGWVQAHPVAPGLHCAYPANIQLVNILLQKKIIRQKHVHAESVPVANRLPYTFAPCKYFFVQKLYLQTFI